MAFVVFSFSRSISLRDAERVAIRAVASARQVDLASKNLILPNTGLDKALEHWKASVSTFDTAFTDLFSRVQPIGNGELTQKTVNARNAWKRISDSVKEGDAIVQAVQSGPYRDLVSSDGVLVAYSRVSTSGSGLAKDVYTLDRLISYQRLLDQFLPTVITALEYVASDLVTISDTYQRRANLVAIIAAIAAFIASLISIQIFSTSLARRVGVLESAMALASKKNFTRRAVDPSKDELGALGRYLNQTLDTLRAFLGDVQCAADGVAALKDELSSESSEVAASLSQIASNVSSVRTELERLRSGIADAAHRIAGVESSAATVFDLAGRQAEGAGRVASSMARMDTAIAGAASLTRERRSRGDALAALVSEGSEKISRSNDSMREIAKDVHRIKEVLELIESVADNTNLLAMNAAIEAAHAGDAGRGFAVVADEIRKLSDTTSDNARTIGEVLGSMASRVDVAMGASEESFASFRTIEDDSSKLAAALDGITRGMDELSALSTSTLSEAKTMAESAMDIKRNAEFVRVNAQANAVLMGDLDRAADSVLSAASEISSGSEGMVASIEHLNAHAETSRERVEELHAGMAGFILEDDSCS